MVKVYYVGDELPEVEPGTKRVPNSIFFAGPTPRSNDVKSWRPGAIKILDDAGFVGSVFVPETPEWGWLGDYDGQVHWEWEALAKAACTLFWVPRNMENMPGMTTNVEFGFMVALRASRVVLGSPPGAPKMRYLHKLLADVNAFHKYFDMEPNFCGVHPEPLQGGGLQSCLALAASVACPDAGTDVTGA